MTGTALTSSSASTTTELPANASLLGLSAPAAASGGQSITVQEVAALEVSGSFAEADAAALRVGQRAAMTFPALPGSAVPGWVTWISPTPSTTGGVVTYEAMVTLEEIPPTIRLGQTATVVVVTAEAIGVLAVPSSAVTVTGPAEGTVELIVDPDRGNTETVPVGIGMEGDISVEITSGLAEGDEILISLDDLGTMSTSDLLNQLGGILQGNRGQTARRMPRRGRGGSA
ncbi:MAG: HlyD family efflux transporter periplasmic adaptor subunit [Bifidobacteriaceae bacterium]|nr:HlyD family efflux transporter periplasmic adaptor subunit [Bifidobacteriaceae bacterium]